MNVDVKILLFLGGMTFGLWLALLLILPYKNIKILELDLNRIIATYSIIAAKSGKPVDVVNQEFKQKFNQAMQQIPAKTIMISKGHLWSKHKLIDGTDNFLQSMGINKTDVKASK